MSDTTRDSLAQLLRGHQTPIPDDGYPADEYECCADAILAEFLVVSRSDIVGTEYGWRAGPDDTNVCPRADRERAVYTAEWRGDGEAVERPALPWSVISLSAERCSDCGLPEGRQPGCGTCHGVPVGPLPEDGRA